MEKPSNQNCEKLSAQNFHRACPETTYGRNTGDADQKKGSGFDITVDLRDGSRLKGRVPGDTSFSLRTDYGTVKPPLHLIRALKFVNDERAELSLLKSNLPGWVKRCGEPAATAFTNDGGNADAARMKFGSAMPRAPQKQMPSRRQRRKISRHLTLRGAKKGRLHRLLKARTTLPQSHAARKVPLPATMGSLSYAFPAPGIRRTGLFECPVA